jgi:eukaryotic-like serine/threonine-protein kinase
MKSTSDALFGAVAVELDVIDVPRLAAVLRECGSKSDMSLVEVLLRRQWMTPEQRGAIDDRVNQLASERSGERAGEFQQEAESEADVAAPGAEADDRFHRTVLFSDGQMHGTATTVDFKSISRSKYTLTRVHGRGGLGRVWLARDRQLQREVALKELAAGKADDEGAKSRLIKEAQVTGQLEHPNIVPVYDLDEGAAEEGPFYTMRFLRGETLKDAIDRYHKSGQADRMELRRLLQAFVNICHAIAYAHSRGVVHRDLKPSNIVLGDFGEVIVIDWGLAFLVNDAESGEGPKVQTAGPSDERELEEGHPIGTPAYMAPEQADGRQALVNRSTDIYGLGGVLFNILTGRPPHAAPSGGSSLKDTMDLLKRISSGPTPRVRAMSPSVPAPLDAICAKSMARAQADRYATASELADDAQRWLADEPVAVYREPWHDRLFRWLRRRRAAVIAGGWSLVAVAVACAVAAFVMNEARRTEAAAKQKAEDALAAEQKALDGERAARAEALERFKDARATVDKSMTGVSQVLQFYPGVQPLRESLLQKAAEDYERFTREKSNDPDLQLEAGRAFIRLGNVRRELGQWKRAAAAYRRAVDLCDGLAERRPGWHEPRTEAANARSGFAFVLLTLGRSVEAEELMKTAVDRLDRLAAESGGAAAVVYAQAAALLNYADLLDGMGRRKPAIELLQKAEAQFGALHTAHSDVRYLHGVARARSRLGAVLFAEGRYADAIARLRAAVAAYRQLTRKDHDGNIEYARGLTNAQTVVANALRVTGRDELIVEIYEDVLKEQIVLDRAQPGLPIHRENIARTRVNLAQMLRTVGRCSDARKEARAGANAFAELLRRHGTVKRYHVATASALLTLGFVQCDLQEDEAAAAALRAAVERLSDIVRLLSATVRDRLDLADSEFHLAALYDRQGRVELARKWLDESVTQCDLALKSSRDDPAARDSLARSLQKLGDLLYETKGPKAASEAYRRCREVRQGLQSAPEHVYRLCSFLIDCRDKTYRDPRRASDLLGQMTQQIPDSPRYWSLLGGAQILTQEYSQALKSLNLAIRKRKTPHPVDWYRLAMAQSKLARPSEARAAFAKAEAMRLANMPGNPDLLKLRQTAATVLGINLAPVNHAPVRAPRP